MNTPLTDNIEATIAKIRADHEVELGKMRTALRECEGENAKLRDEGAEMRTKMIDRDQMITRLELAAPVMLTAFALLADEADRDGLAEIVEWYHGRDDDALALWLDIEKKRIRLAELSAVAAEKKESSGG